MTLTDARLRAMVRSMIRATGWPLSAAVDAVAQNIDATPEIRDRLERIHGLYTEGS